LMVLQQALPSEPRACCTPLSAGSASPEERSDAAGEAGGVFEADRQLIRQELLTGHLLSLAASTGAVPPHALPSIAGMLQAGGLIPKWLAYTLTQQPALFDRAFQRVFRKVQGSCAVLCRAVQARSALCLMRLIVPGCLALWLAFSHSRVCVRVCAAHCRNWQLQPRSPKGVRVRERRIGFGSSASGGGERRHSWQPAVSATDAGEPCCCTRLPMCCAGPFTDPALPAAIPPAFSVLHISWCRPPPSTLTPAAAACWPQRTCCPALATRPTSQS
jgi:hypothetical protein